MNMSSTSQGHSVSFHLCPTSVSRMRASGYGMNDNPLLIWAAFISSTAGVPLSGVFLSFRVIGGIAPLLYKAIELLPSDIILYEISQMLTFIGVVAMYFVETTKLSCLDSIFGFPFVWGALVD